MVAEKHHVQVSTNLKSLVTLAYLRPFTQQIDVIFSSENVELKNLLSELNYKYAKGKVNLAQVLATGPSFVRQYTPQSGFVGPEGSSQRPRSNNALASKPPSTSSVLALSIKQNGFQTDDVWCIDPRGILTICVSKETCEKLGLVGQRLPFNGGEKHVISIPLYENADSPNVQARRRRAFELWDRRFSNENESTGSGLAGPELDPKGLWDVVYCSGSAMNNDNNTNTEVDLHEPEKWTKQIPVTGSTIKSVTCEKVDLQNIWVPDFSSIPTQPKNKKGDDDDDELEDWNEVVSALFEWVGMIGIHSQRLQVNDRVDPYVAVYETPNGSQVGNVTHLRWNGFLSPGFVQSVIDICVNSMKTSQSKEKEFVAITAIGITNSPVVYLPQNKAKAKAPYHLPREDGEDTWSLILAPETQGGNVGGSDSDGVKSIMVESIGQWDGRLG